MLAPWEQRILGNGAFGAASSLETVGGDPGDLSSYGGGGGLGSVHLGGQVGSEGSPGLSVELEEGAGENKRGLGVCLAQHRHSVNKSPFLEQTQQRVGAAVVVALELAAGASPEPGVFDSPMDPSGPSLHFLSQTSLFCFLVPPSMTRKAKTVKSHSAASGMSLLLDA